MALQGLGLSKTGMSPARRGSPGSSIALKAGRPVTRGGLLVRLAVRPNPPWLRNGINPLSRGCRVPWLNGWGQNWSGPSSNALQKVGCYNRFYKYLSNSVLTELSLFHSICYNRFTGGQHTGKAPSILQRLYTTVCPMQNRPLRRSGQRTCPPVLPWAAQSPSLDAFCQLDRSLQETAALTLPK